MLRKLPIVVTFYFLISCSPRVTGVYEYVNGQLDQRYYFENEGSYLYLLSYHGTPVEDCEGYWRYSGRKVILTTDHQIHRDMSPRIVDVVAEKISDMDGDKKSFQTFWVNGDTLPLIGAKIYTAEKEFTLSDKPLLLDKQIKFYKFEVFRSGGEM